MALLTASQVRKRHAARLTEVGQALADAADSARLTVLCIPRHGHGTTRICIERLYETIDEPFTVLYIDIGSPPAVAAELQQMASELPGFTCLRIDEWTSRQSARLLVLDHIATPYTLLIDNNMRVEPGCVARLVATAERCEAAVVSPLILMQGGRVHFSGSRIEPIGGDRVRRTQTTPECRMGRHWRDADPQLTEMDFAESHCALLRTEAFRGRAAELFIEQAHNSHSLAVASFLLKREHGERLVVEQEAHASILPLGFGYDIPWLFGCYNDLEAFQDSYVCHERFIGKSADPMLKHLGWHRKHLLSVLLTVPADHPEARDRMMTTDEVPDSVVGYDVALPKDAVKRVHDTLMPMMRARYPEWVAHFTVWLYRLDAMMRQTPQMAEKLSRISARRSRPGPLSARIDHWQARFL